MSFLLYLACKTEYQLISLCHAKAVIIITADPGEWNIRRFDWDETTGKTESDQSGLRIKRDIYESIPAGSGKPWEYFRYMLQVSHSDASNRMVEPVIVEIDGYEIPVLVEISHQIRNRLADFRTLPNRLRGYIEDSIYPDGVAFKMAEFGGLRSLNFRGTALEDRYVETEIFRRSKASGFSFSSCRPSTYQLA